MIELENVSFSYGSKRVLENVSLHVGAGERILLSAPSGGGKTTLLRLILGLERAKIGRVDVRAKAISAVFQEDRLIASATVLENVRLFGEDAQSLLCRLGLGDVLNRRPGALSGGQRRRVALARALAHPCELLVLDEPFTGLDDETKRLCLSVINETAAALVMASHDRSDATALNARIVELEEMK